LLFRIDKRRDRGALLRRGILAALEQAAGMLLVLERLVERADVGLPDRRRLHLSFRLAGGTRHRHVGGGALRRRLWWRLPDRRGLLLRWLRLVQRATRVLGLIHQERLLGRVDRLRGAQLGRRLTGDLALEGSNALATGATTATTRASPATTTRKRARGPRRRRNVDGAGIGLSTSTGAGRGPHRPTGRSGGQRRLAPFVTFTANSGPVVPDP
jgi:hypothetical protein